ncbi:hypothetical protein ACJJIW_12750 [Microbulbifer sp. JMSA004]|uniref:hypothetical protein n=1 Tax=unclassified Microbulbifer TaxID=2619833 RepID=UPI004039A85F
MNNIKSIISLVSLGVIAILIWLFFSAAQSFRKDHYKGILEFGFEVRAFRVCEGGQSLWVSRGVVDKFKKKYEPNGLLYYPPLYVEMKAALSKKGRYGYGGIYEYEIVPVEIIELTDIVPPECE